MELNTNSNLALALTCLIEKTNNNIIKSRIDRFNINGNSREINLSVYSGTYSVSKLFLVSIINAWTFPVQFMEIEVEKLVKRLEG